MSRVFNLVLHPRRVLGLALVFVAGDVENGACLHLWVFLLHAAWFCRREHGGEAETQEARDGRTEPAALVTLRVHLRRLRQGRVDAPAGQRGAASMCALGSAAWGTIPAQSPMDTSETFPPPCERLPEISTQRPVSLNLREFSYRSQRKRAGLF